MESQDREPGSARAKGAFVTTRWSMILAVGHGSSPEADRALESLCQTYWYPLYGFSRRFGLSVEDAQDSTQEFFARLLEKQFLKSVDPARGRFRSFLLTVFKRFLANEDDRRQAQKRGGGMARFSIDADLGEDRYRFEPSDNWTPERLFERLWALTLLQRVVDLLEQEYAARGKGDVFQGCKPHLTGSAEAPAYGDIARQLKMSETAVRVAVHRLRQRYRELLKAEIGQTVEHSADIDIELNDLRRALRGEKN